MKIEDSILDFLDGNLSSHDEEELLHRLAVSPERRAVLKQHLQVRELSSALARKANYVVPKAITTQLFSTLVTNGYAGPMFHTSADHAASLEQSLVKNLERSAETITSTSRRFAPSSLVLSSLLSFIVGAFVVYSLIPGIGTNGSSPVSVASVQPGVPTAVDGVSAPVSQNEGDMNHGSHTNHPPYRASSQIPSNIAKADNNIPVLSSLTIDEGSLSFSPRVTNVSLSNAASMQNGSIGNTSQVPEMSISYPLANAYLRKWYSESGSLSSDITTEHSPKGYFGFVADDEEHSSIIEHTTASLRSGGGRVAGSSQKISASLIEMKFSADVTDWLVAKVSFGQFMPYETEAINTGLNADGVRSLKLESILQYKSVVGAELGVRFNVLHAPVELMAGVLSDMTDGIIPRASIFTNVMLQDNLSLHIGAEAILYQHDIRPSLRDKQNLFATDHPVLVSAMKEKELDGFIGPAIELAWHF